MDTAQLEVIVDAARLPRPKQVRPIVIVGAGGIVRTAHLPAYQKAGFPVIGIMDEDGAKATALCREHAGIRAFPSLAEAVQFAPPDAVFDLAVPASQFVHILPQLPDRATVLMQKPMGETLDGARAIRSLCRSKDLIASVNFSMRYAPNHLAVAALADQGLLGTIHDLQVQTNTYTPWQLWSFLAAAPRLEILYHSIHYFDLIRSWLGNPQAVFAKAIRNPHTPELAATKTIAILDYGEDKRVFVATNHHHTFGPQHQHSFVQWEGTRGAARIGLGVNLGYPKGVPDSAEYAERDSHHHDWRRLPVSGNNFPDGFMGTMGALQAFAEGSAATLPTHYDDAYQTMALVEALYRAGEHRGESLSLED